MLEGLHAIRRKNRLPSSKIPESLEIPVVLRRRNGAAPIPERLSWRWNGGIVAVGEAPQVTLDRSGSWIFQLEAMDTIGGVDFDSVVVTANLPAECGTL